MRFEISALLAMALAVSPVAAVDVTFYSLTNCNTGGTTTTVWGAGNSQCVARSGLSVRFAGLPGGTKAQTYWNTGCSSYAAERTSNGCITGLNASSTMRSANWFYPFKKLVRKAEPLGPTRYSVKYELPDNTSREIEIPVGPTSFDEVLKLVEDKDFEALAKYPVFVKDA